MPKHSVTEVIFNKLFENFYKKLDVLDLSPSEKDLYYKICLYLKSGQGFISNEKLSELSKKTYNHSKKLLKKLVDSGAIEIVRQIKPFNDSDKLYLHRFVICNIRPQKSIKE